MGPTRHRPIFERSALALLLAALAGCGSRSCGSAEAPAPSPPAAPAHAPVIAIPHTTGPIKLDGELEEEDWKRAARTGPFPDSHGDAARPYSEARWLADDERLYLALYAADEDIRAATIVKDGPVWLDDAFSVVLVPHEGTTLFLDVSASGVLTDGRQQGKAPRDLAWQSNATLGVDRDGTLNDSKDEDEEWVVEMAIPRASLELPPGSKRIEARLSRCDTLKKSQERRCSAWPSELGTTLLDLP